MLYEVITEVAVTVFKKIKKKPQEGYQRLENINYSDSVKTTTTSTSGKTTIVPQRVGNAILRSGCMRNLASGGQ